MANKNPAFDLKEFFDIVQVDLTDKLSGPADLVTAYTSRHPPRSSARDHAFAPEWFLQFDAIVLDLCLGEPRNHEPAGFRLITVLRKFFPRILIVVHTRFGEMAHIEQAFRRGASWFLNKGEEWKLPEHLFKLGENPTLAPRMECGGRQSQIDIKRNKRLDHPKRNIWI